MTYMESYETYTDAESLAKEVLRDIWIATLFGSVDRRKVIIEAAEKVFNKNFPDFKNFETMLSEL